MRGTLDRSGLAAIVLALAALSLSSWRDWAVLDAQTQPRTSTLGLADQANAVPSLAALDRTVVAAWTTTGGSVTNIHIAVSTDGGATFSSPRRVNDRDGEATANPEQAPRVVISGTGKTSSITVFWSQRGDAASGPRSDIVRMSKSIDGGRTFSPARTIHNATFSGARGWHSAAAGADGTIHVVWLDGREAERRIASMKAAGSAMAGKGLPPQDVFHAAIAPDGHLTETVIARDVCFCCKTAVAVDAKGAVYAAWRHIFPGSMRDIAFASSQNNGKQFTPLVRVAEDNWQLNGCPEDGPSLAVDQSGTIHIAWATLVSGTEKGIFYATSRDGKVFSPRSRVPTPGSINSGHVQLAVTSEGGAALAWDQVVEGVKKVAFTRVSAQGAFERSTVLSGDETASNPSVVSAGRDVVVAWTARASVKGSDQAAIRLRVVSR
jgi:hypothetical protein